MGLNMLKKSTCIIHIIQVLYSRQVPNIINIRYILNYIWRKHRV